MILSAGLTDANGDGKLNDELRQILGETAIDLGAPGQDDIFGLGLVDAAAAVARVTDPGAEPPPAPVETYAVELQRGFGPSDNDARQITLAAGFYMVTIKNSRLKKIEMEVFDNGVAVDELSKTIRLRGKRSKTLSFVLDARGGVYDVLFTPEGRTGASAQINLVSFDPPTGSGTATTDLSWKHRRKARW